MIKRKYYYKNKKQTNRGIEINKSYVRSENLAIRDSEANSCEMKMGCSSDAVAPIREITDPSTINFISGCKKRYDNETKSLG